MHKVVALVACCLAVTAWANGRPPMTNGVAFRPGDAQSIYIRSTFGLLVSRDDGCSFRWVCERAIGYGGEFDPKYAVATDGTLFATTFTGLRVSRDGGCTWTTATADKPASDPGRIADLWIDAIDIASNGDVWVASAESAKPNNVYRSTDNGVTFTPRGMLSPMIWWKSVKAAPSNAQRVYLAGYQVTPSPSARFYRSDDAGAMWTEQPLYGEQPSPPTFVFGQTPIVHVSAIDPAQPNTVFVTSLEANPPKGDRLYRSTDGGITFREVLVTADAIRNVFYAVDGSVYVATLGGGSFRSTDGITFTTLVNAPKLGCLGQRSDGALIGCGANWDPDFKAVARTTDAATWDKVFRFVELAGPLECPAGTTSATECDPMWPALKDLFGAKGPTGNANCPLAPDEAPKKNGNGGCCEASAAPGSSLALAGILGLLLRRRRRR